MMANRLLNLAKTKARAMCDPHGRWAHSAPAGCWRRPGVALLVMLVAGYCAAAEPVPAADAAPGATATPADPMRQAVKPVSTNAPMRASTIADMRRRFSEYDRKLRAEDEACARMTAQNAAYRQAMASNDAVILKRVQADPEWLRLRDELAQAQRSIEQMRQQRFSSQRGLALTNAVRRDLRPRRLERPQAPGPAPQPER